MGQPPQHAVEGLASPFYGTLTIRKSTPEERKEKWPPLRGRRRIRIPKYVVISGQTGNICSVFALPLGGDTRAEAVFWAERTASKNGLLYEPPEGWENIEGELKKEVHR